MMEKLGEPQTHLGLKSMIKEVDEDNDGQISFREFMLIFKKAHDGTLEVEGLRTIANVCDVTQEGVKGAKSFFEAKVKEQTRDAKFEQEIKEEQEKKKKKPNTPCLLYTSPSPRDRTRSRMPSSA